MGKQVIYTDRVMEPIAHFSHAVRVGNLVHLGATAGTDARRRLAGTTPGLIDVAAQTDRMFDNVRIVLGLLGADLRNVVRLKTYITDMRDVPAYEASFEQAFPQSRPNHTVVGSAGFPLPQAGIELDLVATVGTAVGRIPSRNAALAEGRCYCTATPVLEATGAAGAYRGTFERQAASAVDQLSQGLAAAGRSLDDVVYLHVTLSDVRLMEDLDACIRAWFPRNPPACTVVIAFSARTDCLLTLETIAVTGGGTPIAADLPAGGSIGSPAVLADDELYIGGQSGVDRSGRLGVGVEAQTRAAWDRIRALLGAVGMSVDHVLRTNNILTDWRSYAGFNAGYGANVQKPYPPRATVLGSLAWTGALVQVEAIAHRVGNTATIVQAGAPG